MRLSVPFQSLAATVSEALRQADNQQHGFCQELSGCVLLVWAARAECISHFTKSISTAHVIVAFKYRWVAWPARDPNILSTRLQLQISDPYSLAMRSGEGRSTPTRQVELRIRNGRLYAHPRALRVVNESPQEGASAHVFVRGSVVADDAEEIQVDDEFTLLT